MKDTWGSGPELVRKPPCELKAAVLRIFVLVLKRGELVLY